MNQKLEPVAVADDEISLLDLLITLAKHKRWIMGITLACGAIGLAIALILPPVYTAKARILPPQQSQSAGMSALFGQMGAMSGMASIAGLKTPNDLYVGMLQSQTVADDLISRFKLKERYKVKYNDDASKKLKDDTNITNGKDGLITIEFSDKDPVFAAQVANAYVDELKKLTESLAVTNAAQRRLFFEKQVNLAKDQLATAENRLKDVQEKSGMLTLDSQVKASITGLAQLKATLAAKEISLQAMKTFATQENPDYQRLNAEVEGLRVQLNQLQAKSADGILATQKIPEAGLEYVRRLRDQKFAETVYELMLKQYELAKIDEAKDTSVVQQLDKAYPPERKSKPKRITIVGISIIVGVLVGFLIAFVRESLARIQVDPINKGKFELLVSLLK